MWVSVFVLFSCTRLVRMCTWLFITRLDGSLRFGANSYVGQNGRHGFWMSEISFGSRFYFGYPWDVTFLPRGERNTLYFIILPTSFYPRFLMYVLWILKIISYRTWVFILCVAVVREGNRIFYFSVVCQISCKVFENSGEVTWLFVFWSRKMENIRRRAFDHRI